MALKLNETYPGRFNNPSADYPQGSFKNRTSPTAQDGSYFEQQWANDQLAFFSSLLSGAGVTANGLVDKVGASQYYSALVSVIAAQSAIPQGLLTSGIAGSFSNLKASASGLSAGVSVTADSICLKDSANKQVVLNSVSVAPSLSSTGANGLDTGSWSASTWYSVWVIWDGTNVRGLFSASATTPTLPSGYTHKARVGWVRTDGTANKYPLPFVQYGRNVSYVVKVGTALAAGLPQFFSGIQGSHVTPTWVSTSVSSFVPPTASMVDVTIWNDGTTSTTMCAPNDAYGAYGSGRKSAPIIASNVGSTSNGAGMYQSGRIKLESTNLYVTSSVSAGGGSVIGWEDNL